MLIHFHPLKMAEESRLSPTLFLTLRLALTVAKHLLVRLALTVAKHLLYS